MESLEEKKKRAVRIVRALKKTFPDAQCKLTFRTPFELLVKTILSAQCTDERVNRIGETLFQTYPGPEEFAKVSQPTLERAIHTAGFFRNKARHIRACAQLLLEQYNGQVPQSLSELTRLPGVGRKTANVLLGNAFGIPAMVVDTHVIRITQLLKLSRSWDPEKIENDLMEMIPKKEWVSFSHRIADHGRAVCIARRPKCFQCSVEKECPSSRLTRNEEYR